jgi:hypothetical protein
MDMALQMLAIRIGAYITALSELAKDSKKLKDSQRAMEVLDNLKKSGLTFEQCIRLYALSTRSSSTQYQEKVAKEIRAWGEIVVKENFLQKFEAAFSQPQSLSSLPMPSSTPPASSVVDCALSWNEKQRSHFPQQQPQPQQPPLQDQVAQFKPNGATGH